MGRSSPELSTAKKLVSVKSARRTLTALWFIYSAIALMLLIINVIGRFESDEINKAFSWYLPSVVPTLSLIIGVLIQNTRQKSIDKLVDRLLYVLAYSLTHFYFMLVFVTLFSEILADILNPLNPNPPSLIDNMSKSHFYLGPCQGLVVACMGAFFVSKDQSGR